MVGEGRERSDGEGEANDALRGRGRGGERGQIIDRDPLKGYKVKVNSAKKL